MKSKPICKTAAARTMRTLWSAGALLLVLALAGCPGLDESGKDICRTDDDCLNGYTCGPDGICVLHRTDCSIDADCPAGRYCADKSCTFDCQGDGDCSGDRICSERGRCVPRVECEHKGDCSLGEVCVDSVCRSGCESSRDCPGELICLPDQGSYGLCAECGRDEDCPPERHCAGGSCVFDCLGDGDCEDGHVCSERGRCVPRAECENKGDCPLGKVCVDSACRPGCETGRDCPGELICLPDQGSYGLCAECGRDEDCPQGKRCVAFACTAACGSAADCQDGQLCDSRGRCCWPRVEEVCTAGVAYWVDSCGNQTQRQVCPDGCDAAGRTCLAGGGTVLCPANCTWRTEVIASLCDYSLYYQCFAGGFDARQDPAGNLHIAWVDGVIRRLISGNAVSIDGEVRLARQGPSGFQSQRVEALSDPESLNLYYSISVSLAIESDGSPHVGYTRPQGPRYARRTGGVWEWVDIFEEDATRMGHLMMDAGDRPHLTYSYYINMFRSGLRYLRWSGAGWELVLSGSPQCYPRVLDAGGLPHAVCWGNGDSLSYGSLSGDVWNTTYVWYSLCKDAEISLGPTGDPHLIFLHDPDTSHDYTEDLYYAAPDGHGGFAAEKIPVPAKVAGGPGLAIDPEGRPHVAFRDYGRRALWYGYKHDGQWKLQVVDDTEYYGNRHQIFITGDGRPTIVRVSGKALSGSDKQLEVISLVP